MSTAAELVAHLEALGARLEARGQVLHVDAPEELLTPGVVAALKRHKGGVMDLLLLAPGDGAEHRDNDLAEFVAYWRELGHPDPERRGREALAVWRIKCSAEPS